MEFGIFLNGYIPGPAAHDTELEHLELMQRGGVRDLRRQAQLEVRLVRRAPRAHRVLAHVGPRGRHGLRGRPDRLHPPLHRHQQHLAAQGAPGPVRRAGRHARPHHRQPLRVRHRSGRRQPRDGHASTSWTPTRPRPTGKRSSGRSRGCGSRSTTLHGEYFSPFPTPHNILPKPYGKGHPPIWVACGQPAHVRAGGRGSASAPSPSTSSRSTPSAAASTPTRRASPTAPTRSASSRTTT